MRPLAFPRLAFADEEVPGSAPADRLGRAVAAGAAVLGSLFHAPDAGHRSRADCRAMQEAWGREPWGSGLMGPIGRMGPMGEKGTEGPRPTVFLPIRPMGPLGPMIPNPQPPHRTLRRSR